MSLIDDPRLREWMAHQLSNELGALIQQRAPDLRIAIAGVWLLAASLIAGSTPAGDDDARVERFAEALRSSLLTLREQQAKRVRRERLSS